MKREEFDSILIEGGILSKKQRDEIWDSKTTDNLSSKKLYRAAVEFRELEPEKCKED